MTFNLTNLNSHSLGLFRRIQNILFNPYWQLSMNLDKHIEPLFVKNVSSEYHTQILLGQNVIKICWHYNTSQFSSPIPWDYNIKESYKTIHITNKVPCDHNDEDYDGEYYNEKDNKKEDSTTSTPISPTPCGKPDFDTEDIHIYYNSTLIYDIK